MPERTWGLSKPSWRCSSPSLATSCLVSYLTGITKFSQLSIFSELNNIQNISILPEYAAICGITEEEMQAQMSADLDGLAGKMNLTREVLLARLKDNYDGYHFTLPSPDMYNPYSLLNAFVVGRINSYWFGSGTPTYLIEMLHKYHIPPQRIGAQKASVDDFDAPTERMTNIILLVVPEWLPHHQGLR